MGAFYGLGFVHAMDRLWQMEFYRKMAMGRLSEIFGSETVQVDKYTRIMGVRRMVDNQLFKMNKEDLLMYENYAAGVNKVVENIQMYPSEFYLFWTEFEPFTVADALSIQYIITVFCSTDWFYELTRERLAEIYPKHLVDKLMPIGKENLFPFENIETISDEELKRINMFEPESKINEVPIDLLHIPYQLGEEAKLKNKLDLDSVKKAHLIKSLNKYNPNF